MSLVFLFDHPGRAALTVLAGAVEACPGLEGVRLAFPRDVPAAAAELRARLEAGDEVVVAFSFYSTSAPASADKLRALRAQVPAGWTAISGGAHATAEPEATLADGYDLVCVGEGERALLELLERARAGAPLSGAAGFAWREGGEVRRGPKATPVALDDFPPFAARAGHFGSIELTRGCIYACRFCQTPFMSKARFRHRSPGSVRRWVRELVAQGKRDVRFITPTALSYGSEDESVNLAAIEALLAGVREELGERGRLFFGTFPSELRPEHVTPEALALLARYVDNDNVILGGQSGSEAVLRASHRGHGVEVIERATRLCLEAGFQPNVDFILGLPGETAADVEATVALMQTLAELGARVHGHTFLPLPGTPYRDAPPGVVPESARLELERLAARGKLYGHWKAQTLAAQALSAARRAGPRGRSPERA